MADTSSRPIADEDRISRLESGESRTNKSLTVTKCCVARIAKIRLIVCDLQWLGLSLHATYVSAHSQNNLLSVS